MNQTYITFLVGLAVGILSIGAMMAAFGKWMLQAVVKEVVNEMAGNWVPTTTGNAYAARIDRLEHQFDDMLKAFAQKIGE